jgi:hypothetical protein
LPQCLDAEMKGDGHAQDEGIFDAVMLDRMEFAPIKSVVPGVFVEGLTLFCGKPKIGKSWLLLHAATAVASGRLHPRYHPLH